MTKNKTWLVSLFPFIFQTLSVFISCDYQYAIPFTECDNYVFDYYDSDNKKHVGQSGQWSKSNQCIIWIPKKKKADFAKRVRYRNLTNTWRLYALLNKSWEFVVDVIIPAKEKLKISIYLMWRRSRNMLMLQENNRRIWNVKRFNISYTLNPKIITYLLSADTSLTLFN